MIWVEKVMKRPWTDNYILSIPNEDFGRMNKRWNPDVRSTFQGREYSIWATNHWKVSRKSGFHLCSSFQNLRLGSMHLDAWKLPKNLCSPNEEFGRPNKHFRTRFPSTFQRFVAQILYSQPWKVLRKCVLKRLFGLPNYSFGRVELLLLLSIVLIYVFDATFDRGLKVRLFCSPQWLTQWWCHYGFGRACESC